MQARFLNTTGTLADRLMAALQGAKVIGADTRCAVHNTSSQSSFLRVAKMTDPYDTIYCDLWMAYPSNQSGIFPTDPIDSLQTLYNIWKATLSIHENGQVIHDLVKVYTSEKGVTAFDFTLCKNWQNMQVSVFDMLGRNLLKKAVTARIMRVNTSELIGEGIFLYRVTRSDQSVVSSGKFFDR